MSYEDRAEKLLETGCADDGAALLDDVHNFLTMFVVYPNAHAADAHTLWIAHAHAMDAWSSTPRIAFLSPEPGSGKTRALEITETLVPRPIQSINATPAYLFRKISDETGAPTILYDELDALWGSRATAQNAEEVRAILNSGHRCGAMAGRCVVKGKTIETEELPSYCAVALAGLGDLPDTLLSRSVIIRMRRKAPGESVEPFRARIHTSVGNGLRDRLEKWTGAIMATLCGCYPKMPDGIEDRNADVWEALIAVADAAGGSWPERARAAAVALVKSAREETPSLGIRLLADLRQVFGDAEAMATEEILRKLAELDEAPWGDMKGGPINARRLAGMLRRYAVKRTQIRIGSWNGRGYRAEDLRDPWSRYLGPATKESETTETKAGQRDVDGGG